MQSLDSFISNVEQLQDGRLKLERFSLDSPQFESLTQDTSEVHWRTRLADELIRLSMRLTGDDKDAHYSILQSLAYATISTLVCAGCAQLGPAMLLELAQGCADEAEPEFLSLEDRSLTFVYLDAAHVLLDGGSDIAGVLQKVLDTVFQTRKLLSTSGLFNEALAVAWMDIASDAGPDCKSTKFFSEVGLCNIFIKGGRH